MVDGRKKVKVSVTLNYQEIDPVGEETVAESTFNVKWLVARRVMLHFLWEDCSFTQSKKVSDLFEYLRGRL